MIKAFNKGRLGDGRSIDEKLLDEYNIYLEHADNGNGIITETWGIRLRCFTHEGI